jgi:hypothetical protein
LNFMVGEASCARRLCSPKICIAPVGDHLCSCGAPSMPQPLFMAFLRSLVFRCFHLKQNHLWAIASPSYSLTWFWRITNDHFIKWYQVAFSCFITTNNTTFLFYHLMRRQNLGERTEGCSEGLEEVKVETWTSHGQIPGSWVFFLALGMSQKKITGIGFDPSLKL